MSRIERGQVSASAAEVYEEFYLPALFGQWAGRMAEAARVAPGQRALDVACGTGALARELAARVGPAGAVVGLDVNDDMLAVARRVAPAVEWRRGAAESLPFPSESFDAVLSQFGLMFFEDRPLAIREMMRVLRPGGRLAVAVWDALERSPGYAALAALLERLFGEETARALRSPFALGNAAALRDVFRRAGAPDVDVAVRDGTARFPSIDSWVFTEVKGWTAADRIDAAGYERLLAEARRELAGFSGPDGRVAFAAPALIATVERR